MVDRRWAAALLLMLIPGCLDDDGSAGIDGDGVQVEEVPVQAIVHDATGCSMGVLVLLRDAADLLPFLPSGFVPADAQGLLGTPAPVGMGAAVLTAYHCDHSDWLDGPLDAGEINILVQDPGLAAGSIDDHYFLAELTTAPGPLSERLRADGWNVVDGSSALASAGPAAGLLEVEVKGTSLSYSATLSGVAPNALAGASRFWHVTPNGPAWFDYVVAADVLVGAADPQYGEGTLAARLAAADGPPALGIAVPAFAWQATYQPPASAA